MTLKKINLSLIHIKSIRYQSMRGFSLRTKVLVLMTAITAVTLSALLLVAVRIFTSDKVADIKYASAALAQALATQGRIELESLLNTLKFVMAGYQVESGLLSPEAEQILKKDVRIKYFYIYKKTPEGFVLGQSLQNTTDPQPQLPAVNSQIQITARNGASVTVVQTARGSKLALAIRLGSEATQTIVISIVDDLHFVKSVQGPGIYALALLGEKGQTLFKNDKTAEFESINFSEWPLVEEVQRIRSPPGTSEVTDNHDTLITSYANVGFGTMTVLAFISKKESMQAIQSFIFKSVMVFLTLLVSSFLIASLASKQITSALSRLTSASQQVATGQFNVNIDVQTGDEIGTLANSFNIMTKQLKFYVQEVAEKALLESELNTARTVQETLFPLSESKLGPLEVAGYYEPASQCGGDWWHYCHVGDRILLWIGDATGHGVPAALLTSAARSAASIIELFPQITPAQAMKMLNRAIHETSRGKLLMTFVIAFYDPKTGELTYANASHEAPLLAKRTEGEQYSKKDIVPLNAVKGPRLGEKLDARYDEAKIKLGSGDRVFFYTDGLSDLKDPEGVVWGERKFLKTIVSALNTGTDAQSCTQMVANEAQGYRGKAKLDDDITYFFIRINDEAA